MPTDMTWVGDGTVCSLDGQEIRLMKEPIKGE